jgi:hypothetical protein
MNTQFKLWYLENFGMLRALSKAEKEKLDSMADMRHTPKKQVLYFPTDSSNFVCRAAGKTRSASGVVVHLSAYKVPLDEAKPEQAFIRNSSSF